MVNIDEMKNELKILYQFYSKYGEVIDLNLDNYPNFIAVTFRKHSDVLKILKE